MSNNEKQMNSDKIGFGQIFLWQSRGISNSMNIMLMSFVMIYCTNALGLSTVIVGTILMASKILDGIVIIFTGYLVDRTNTKIGRGRPYELFLIPYWICTVLLFACPANWELTVKYIWVLIMYSLVNAIFGAFLGSSQLPYMVRAYNNQKKYVALTSYGGAIAMIGAMIIQVILPSLIDSMATSASGWTKLVIIFAIPATLVGLLRFIFVPEKYNVDAKTEKINFKEVLMCLKTNKYIYAIALMVLIYNLVSNMGVLSYYYTYVVGNIGLMGIASLISMVMLPIMFIMPMLMKKTTLTNIMFWGFFSCCIGCVINWFAYDNFPVLLIGGFFTGIGMVPVAMMNGLLVIECADYNEWKGLPRLEGTLGVIPGLATQVGSAFGAFLLGIFLQMGKFTTSIDSMNIQQPDSAILMLRLLMSFIPLGLYAIAAIACKFYTLDKKMPQIREELELRRNMQQNNN